MAVILNIEWKHVGEIEQTIDPLLFKLIAGIDTFGSLQKAVNAAGVSYRFGWGLISKWEKALEIQLVTLERGRGAYLSPGGRLLLQKAAEIEMKLTPNLANLSSDINRQIQNFISVYDDKNSLKIYASHGIAVSTLRDILTQNNELHLDLHFHGSIESLKALKYGDCHIAGFHIPDGDLANAVKDAYLEWLTPESHELMYLVRRNQGLMYDLSNPFNIESIHDLKLSTLRFVNRQQSSGTRILFDALLHREGIAHDAINGYQHEEFTHIAIAAMIASKAADVGFGIAPVAKSFNLGYLPLVWEHYCLAIPVELKTDDRIRQIQQILLDRVFRDQLKNMEGYDITNAGEFVEFGSVFK